MVRPHVEFGEFEVRFIEDSEQPGDRFTETEISPAFVSPHVAAVGYVTFNLPPRKEFFGGEIIGSEILTDVIRGFHDEGFSTQYLIGSGVIGPRDADVIGPTVFYIPGAEYAVWKGIVYVYHHVRPLLDGAEKTAEALETGYKVVEKLQGQIGKPKAGGNAGDAGVVGRSKLAQNLMIESTNLTLQLIDSEPTKTKGAFHCRFMYGTDIYLVTVHYLGAKKGYVATLIRRA